MPTSRKLARRFRQDHRRFPGTTTTFAGADRCARQFPNLLVNGSAGIAVGMATNIPPHNLGDVIDACIAHLDNPEIGIDELAQIVKGPDFPTGARILGRAGILAAYHKGRGSILMRATANIEEIRKDREAIIITAIPYQVNKRVLIEKIAEQVREKRIEGIVAVCR